MNSTDFHKLVHLVIDKNNVPNHLFVKGFDDWHARARLAHFLELPEFDMTETALELFHSIVEIEVDEEISEDVEEKTFALQKLSQIYRDQKQLEKSLKYINLAIETAESSDFLYKYISRGELWADRWALLHLSNKTKVAEDEINERIAVFEDISLDNNSYLFYGYRFKAQLAAENDDFLICKDYIYMAYKYISLPPSTSKKIKQILSQNCTNSSWLLKEVDLATPNPNTIKWDI